MRSSDHIPARATIRAFNSLSKARRTSLGRPEMNATSSTMNHSEKRRRVEQAVVRKLMDDLEEVVRGDFQHADQRLLNGRGHIGETLLVVSTFEHMNFYEWHFRVSLLAGHESRFLKSLERKRN